ncbi:MAG: hypothetical protein M3N43_03265 [Actinomycetota bacterium]|nr:hypothetical protein [Actinomycetota bacterium]
MTRTPETQVKVKVLQSRRLSLEGVLRKVGDVVKVSESQAHAWIANGWAEIVVPKKGS